MRDQMRDQIRKRADGIVVESDPPLPGARWAWDCALGHAVCGDRASALEREWLVTNGIGGYAAGTLAGATTRRYHGLLVAALRPPVARTVLVTKIDETIIMPDGAKLELGTNEYADGTIAPSGFTSLQGFALEGGIARWRYGLPGGATLEKRVWMEHGENTTYVRYHLVALPELMPNDAPQAVMLSLAPFCVDRDYHSHEHGDADWRFEVVIEPGRAVVQARPGATAVALAAGPAATWTTTGAWYWHILHRAERERGLDDEEDVYQPCTLSAALGAGQTLTVVLSAEATLPEGFDGPGHEAAGAAALKRERTRAARLLERAATGGISGHLSDDWDPDHAVLARLVLAADQFLVARSIPATAANQPATAGRSVIAGYPWFTDWGRDTMIALPGLTLATGRTDDARLLLATFARFLDRGMLPNRFPDGGETLSDGDYNTVDATLWYFVAIERYVAATGDVLLLGELWPGLTSIIAWHQRGTRFGIGVDERDGLLRAGANGVQLTWMDAKVGDWVVTPRRGKPVEVNALWHHALALMERWAADQLADPIPYRQARERAGASFAARFWHAEGGYLYDVVDVDGVDGATDAALRPNQAIALALPTCPLDDDRARAALAVVERRLVTPLGLRTLAPDVPHFVPHYTGDQHARDGAYHQGLVWPWLIGSYLDARTRLAGDANEVERARQQILAPFRDHLLEAGIGSISEIAEPLPPYRPVGCFAQAWSVAELLRCWSKR